MPELHACSSETPDLTAYLAKQLCTRKTVKTQELQVLLPNLTQVDSLWASGSNVKWGQNSTSRFLAFTGYACICPRHVAGLDLLCDKFLKNLSGLKFPNYLRNRSDLTRCREGTEHPTQYQTWTQRNYLEIFFFPCLKLSTGTCLETEGLIIFRVAALAHGSFDFLRHWAEEKGWRKHWGYAKWPVHSPTPADSDGWPSAWPLNEAFSYAPDVALAERSSLCPGKSLSLLWTGTVSVRPEQSTPQTSRRLPRANCTG